MIVFTVLLLRKQLIIRTVSPQNQGEGSGFIVTGLGCPFTVQKFACKVLETSLLVQKNLILKNFEMKKHNYKSTYRNDMLKPTVENDNYFKMNLIFFFLQLHSFAKSINFEQFLGGNLQPEIYINYFTVIWLQVK